MTILITGGAGYIGGHLVNRLKDCNRQIIIIDNLETGKTTRIPKGIELQVVDIRNRKALARIFESNKINSVVHLAAYKSVTEGELNLNGYHDVNVTGTYNLLELSAQYKVKKFIFISTAAVYGSNLPVNGVVDEKFLAEPTSVYGKTKLAAEALVAEFSQSSNITAVSLRLFNVAGQKNGILRDSQLTNLIPIVKNSLLKSQPIKIFGNDYPTHDGTAIRDYIHVMDVVEVIHRILFGEQKIENIINVGSGVGRSVLEVVFEMESKLGIHGLKEFYPRRIGDVGAVVADVNLLSKQLDFKIEKKFDLLI